MLRRLGRAPHAFLKITALCRATAAAGAPAFSLAAVRGLLKIEAP